MKPVPPPEEQDSLDAPTTFDAPLVNLVRADLTQMSDEELRAYLTRIRTLRGSAPTKKATITKSTKAGAIDFDHLLGI